MAQVHDKWKGSMSFGFLTMLGILLVMQVVPYGREHDNPDVQQEPPWSSSTVRELAARACFDCHSNETRWPWYSRIAPVSWIIQNDVEEGRKALNFSEWQRNLEEMDEAARTVLRSEMPPKLYLPLHPRARLTAVERHRLADGLRQTVGSAARHE